MFGLVLKLSGMLVNNIDLLAVVTFISISAFLGGSTGGITTSALHELNERSNVKIAKMENLFLSIKMNLLSNNYLKQ
jgi:hypothetical protein